jgi:hypothetical protein
MGIGEDEMDLETWIRGPIGAGAETRITRPVCRTALVVVPTVAAGTRLMDIVPLLEADHRIQVMFTVPHTTDAWHGVEDFVRAQHGLVLPWHQALQHTFDLILAASHRHLEQLQGKILLVPHGAGSLKSRLYSRKAGGATIPSTGLDRELLTFRGRIIPATVALSTDDEREALQVLCPEAAPRAIVAGDVCLDRLYLSMGLREHYRHSLGITPHRQLITISSTWSADSAFGRLPRLCREVLDAVPPARYAVALVLHPNVWTVHGRRQVTAWLSNCLSEGLLLIPPDEGWRATMIASDWVIGDHGSTTAYAAAIGRPVSLATYPHDDLREGSIADLVRQHAPSLRYDRPLLQQAEQALVHRDALTAAVGTAISTRPRRTAAILRSAMYRLLDLSEPSIAATVATVAAPQPVRG